MCASLRPIVRGGVLALLASALAASAHELPSRPRQDFVAPAPGSYRLPAIQAAPDGNVLDADGAPERLAHFVTGSVTLLGFIYTYCTDPGGCPLAYDTFLELRRRIVADPKLRGRVRFVSLSFDPANDTPAAMRLYGGDNASGRGPLPWHFLTTRSMAELAPMLEDFGQDVAADLDDGGHATRTLNHMLKVFLIDRRGVIREIYTTAFLLPEVMLNDIKTLVMEEDARRPGWAQH
jgi:protein SCO1